MRIILFFLKCLVGLFAALGFLLVAAVVAGSLFWRHIEPLAVGDVEVPEATVLTLDLADPIVESRPDNALAWASLGDALVMREVLQALDAAGRDGRVRGLFLRLGRGTLGLAETQELRDSIKELRGQGRFVVAFAESFAEMGHPTIDYHLASAAGEIWLQPSGELALTGFFVESPFLRGILDKIGVVPRLDQREEYKGIMNTFTDAALPEPQRRNLQQLADSWLEQIVAGSADDRGLTPRAFRALVDGAPFAADAAREHGLIDRLGYLDEARAAALAAAEVTGGGPPQFLDMADYIRVQRAEAQSGAVVALIYGLGPIELGGGENDPVFGDVVMGADSMALAFREAIEDPEVRAIILRIDSPGGSYVAADAIWREVRRANDEGVPVIASMGNVAASGGYFVAAPAHAIVAQPGTVTGSIGVAAGKMVLSGLWDKLGVAWDGVKAGAQADMWSANADFSPAAWASLQATLDRVYADFTAKVAEGRGLSAEQLSESAKGRIWSGADAKALGLVDALGGLRTATTLAREAAGIGPGESVQLKVFPEPRDPFETLLERALSAELRGPTVRAVSRALARTVQALAPIVRAVEAMSGDARGPVLRVPDLRPAN